MTRGRTGPLCLSQRSQLQTSAKRWASNNKYCDYSWANTKQTDFVYWQHKVQKCQVIFCTSMMKKSSWCGTHVFLMCGTNKGYLVFYHQVCLAKVNSAATVDVVVLQDLSLGEGQSVENGDSVEVVYTGWLLENHTCGQVEHSHHSFNKYQCFFSCGFSGYDNKQVFESYLYCYRCLTPTKTKTSCCDWRLELGKWSEWVKVYCSDCE